MYNTQDFLDLFNALTYDNGSNVDPILYSIAMSERAKAISFFKNTLDQIAFGSQDYKNLRVLLINWYSTFRAFTRAQQLTTDVHSMPSDYLNELFFSFGFTLGNTLRFIPKSNRDSFFLGLVDMYKTKGTPKTLFDFLEIAGLPNVELLEYWLMKQPADNEDGYDVVFKGKVLESNMSIQLLSQNAVVDYEQMIENDPHWFMTREQLNQCFKTEKIQFPSKSPYFSVRFAYDVDDMAAGIAYLHRIVMDNYKAWVAHGKSQAWEASQRTIKSECNMDLSILEVFLGCNYMINERYRFAEILNPPGTDLYWAGDSTATIRTVIDLYEALVSSDNTSRAQIDIKRAYWNSLFTISVEDNSFTPYVSNPGALIYELNPGFKDLIDDYIFSGKDDTLLYYLFDDLTLWAAEQIGGYAPYIGLYTLDVTQQSYVMNAINFFKPYRARMAYAEKGIIVGNRLFDQLLVEDEGEWLDVIKGEDYDIADSSSIIIIDSTAAVQYTWGSSRSKWDLGSRFDIGASTDDFTLEIEDTYDDIYNIHRFHDGYITDSTQCYYNWKYLDSTNMTHMMSVGGFVDFDRGWTFDRPAVCDYFEMIYYDPGELFYITNRDPVPLSSVAGDSQIIITFSNDLYVPSVTDDTFYVYDDGIDRTVNVDLEQFNIVTFDCSLNITKDASINVDYKYIYINTLDPTVITDSPDFILWTDIIEIDWDTDDWVLW